MPNAGRDLIRHGFGQVGGQGHAAVGGHRVHPPVRVDPVRDRHAVDSGGENVHPAQVEDALGDHPGIADSLVVGVPDERWASIVATRRSPRRSHAHLKRWGRAVQGAVVPALVVVGLELAECVEEMCLVPSRPRSFACSMTAKEVARQDRVGLAVEESGPGVAVVLGCGFDAVLFENLSHRGGSDRDAEGGEGGELAVDATVGPAGILPGQARM